MSVDNNKVGVIAANENYFVLDNLYTNTNGFYCDFDTRKIITDETSVFCGSVIENNEYVCSSAGVCTITAISNDRETLDITNNKICKFTVNTSDKKIITSYSTDSGMMIFKNDETKISDFSSVTLTDLENSKLYDCQEGICTVTSGFVKYSSNNSVAKCDATGCGTAQTVSSCDDSNVGQAYFADSAFKICANPDGTAATESTITTVTQNYITSLTVSGATTYNLYVSDNDGNLIGLSNSVPSGTYMINLKLFSLTKDTGVTGEKLTTSGMMVFKGNDLTKFGKLVESSEFSTGFTADDLSKMMIFECNSGTCVATTGYLKHGSSNEVVKCNTSCSTTQSSVTCGSSNIGTAYYSSGFKICVDSYVSSSVYEEKTIATTGRSYIFSYATPNYNLYLSDDGGNLIGLYTSGGYFKIDIDLDSKADTIDVVSCTAATTGSTCVKADNGYYLLSNGETNKDFVYCTSGACTVSSKSTNGYYINSDKKTIKCSSSSCVLFDAESVNTCTDNKNKIISDSGTLKYCNGETLVDFSTTMKFITLTVKASDTSFPDSIVTTDGTDKLLLKMEQYSITEFTTGSGYYLVDITSDVGTLYECNTVSDNVVCIPQTSPRGYFVVTDESFKKVMEYIKCDSSGCKHQATPTPAATTCTIDNLVLNEDIVKLCIDSTSSIMVPFSNTPTNYLFNIGSTNTFTSSVSGEFVMITASETSITVTDLTNKMGYYIVDTGYKLLSTAAEGTLYNCITNTEQTPFISCKAVTNHGYYKNADTSKTSVIPYIKVYQDLTTGTPVEKTEAIGVQTSVTCAEGKIGQLSNGGLCLDGTNKADFQSTGEKSYFVSYHEGSIFLPEVTEIGKFGVVKITTNSMTIDTSVASAVCRDNSNLEKKDLEANACSTTQKKYVHCTSGICYNDCNASTGADCLAKRYYLFSDADGTTAEKTLSNSGFLYYCETAETVCTKITTVGYYKNINALTATSAHAYIKCSADSTANNATKCTYLTNPAAGSTCTSIGDIISTTAVGSTETTYSLCIATASPGISIDLSTTGKYFVDVNGNTSAFGKKEGNYVLVIFDGKNALLSLPENNVERYRYSSKTNQKLIDFNDSTQQSEYCGTGKSPLTDTTYEFSLVPLAESDPTNYYKKN